MTINEIFEKGRKYPVNFFYCNLNKIEKTYEFAGGFFVIGKDGEENVLFWGVNKLDDLKRGLDEIKKENKNFRFTYAGNLDNVLEATETICEWGYSVKNTHVGYVLDMNNSDFQIDNMSSIEELSSSDIKKLLQIERKIFDSYNVSEEELIEWVKSDDYINLVYKKDEEIVAYIFISIYGDKKDRCFVRNLGVVESQRRKGIGEKLILRGLQIAKDKGAEKSMLWVGFHNKGARSLYEKIGYELDESEAEVVFCVNK